MAYCTYDDFDRYGASVEIDESDFDVLAERAADIIDECTSFKLVNGAFDKLSEFDKRQVTRAACAQVEYLYYNGVETAFNGSASGSYRIGNTSVVKDTGGSNAGNSRICKTACSLLFPTGLLYKGVDCV